MVGVCIKYYHANYGGMLQAYATTALLEELGLEYELIRYIKKRTLIEKAKLLPRLLNGVLLNDKYEALLKRVGEKTHPEFARNNTVRTDAFYQFCKDKFVKLSPEFLGYKALCAGASRYSAVLTGSDQLWSPAGLPTNFYNLMFVPYEKQKISLASSFGVNAIPWYQHSRTRQYLERIQRVSVRENRAAEIVEELTGRKVPVLPDPVFAFSREEWKNLVPEQRLISDDYLFCYFLGSNHEYRVEAKKIAEARGLKIVTLRHLDRYVKQDESFGDYAPYDIGPQQFLNILRNAKLVCTDSFHGTAFSIIHGIKFLVFDRYKINSPHSKNSRIDTICRNLGLENRRFTESCDAEAIDQPIDYDSISKKLDGYRQEIRDYLTESFADIQTERE